MGGSDVFWRPAASLCFWWCSKECNKRTLLSAFLAAGPGGEVSLKTRHAYCLPWEMMECTELMIS